LVETVGVFAQLVHVLVADVDRQASETGPGILEHVFDLTGAQECLDHVGAGLSDPDRVNTVGRLVSRRAVVHRQSHDLVPLLV
jgi:hypothetical protein